MLLIQNGIMPPIYFTETRFFGILHEKFKDIGTPIIKLNPQHKNQKSKNQDSAVAQSL